MFVEIFALRLIVKKFCHYFQNKNINRNRHYVNVDNSKTLKRICDVENIYLNLRRAKEIHFRYI